MPKAVIFLPPVTKGIAKVTGGASLLFVTFCMKNIQKSPPVSELWQAFFRHENTTGLAITVPTNLL